MPPVGGALLLGMMGDQARTDCIERGSFRMRFDPPQSGGLFSRAQEPSGANAGSSGVGLRRHDLLLDLVRGRLGDDLSVLLLTAVSTTMRHVSLNPSGWRVSLHRLYMTFKDERGTFAPSSCANNPSATLNYRDLGFTP